MSAKSIITHAHISGHNTANADYPLPDSIPRGDIAALKRAAGEAAKRLEDRYAKTNKVKFTPAK